MYPTVSSRLLARETEERLRRLGVPAFASGGPTWNHGRIMPLLWMLAFELGVATAMSADVPMTTLLVSAPFVALAAFLTRPISASALGIEASRSGWGLLPLAVLPVSGFYLLRVTLLPLRYGGSAWSWPSVWSDAAVILVSLYAAAILLLAAARPRSRRADELLWAILVFVAGSHFAHDALFPVEVEVDGIRDHASIVALFVAVVVLAAALWVRRMPPVRHRIHTRYAPASPAAVLIVMFGLTHGLLAYFFDSTTFLVNNAVSVLLVGWAIGRRWISVRARDGRTRNTAGETVRKLIDEPNLRYWIPIFVLAYPLFALAYGWGRPSTVFGYHVRWWGEAIVLIGFNLLYVALVWILVGFGLDRVTNWAAVEAWKKRAETLKRMAGATPLLLIFVMFFALTAETWQIAANLSLGRLCALLAVFAGLIALLVTGWSAALIRKLRFGDWARVEVELDDCAGDREFGGLPERLRSVLSRSPCGRPAARRLRTWAWVNALLVLLVYQSFTHGAVVLTLFLTFLMLVLLAVPSGVAAEWIFGDGQAGRQSELVKIAFDSSVLASPWLRVSAFLALFSLLYFVALSLADADKRAEYFRGIDIAMRRRIAMYLCYRHLRHVACVAPTPAATPAPRPAGGGAPARRPISRPGGTGRPGT